METNYFVESITDLFNELSKSEDIKHKISLKDAVISIMFHNNFKIEITFAIAVVIASFILKVSLIEWIVLIFLIGTILALEMINTAIERCVDLATKDYKELAKISKDVAAGAVLIMSLFSVVIGIIIFLPKIFELIVIGGK